MNAESDTRNPGERLVRVLFLHSKTTVPSIVPADCAQYGCIVETAKYGGAVCCHLLKRDFDVIVASIEEGQTLSQSVLLREIQRIWHWIGWVVAAPSSTPDTDQLARDLGAKNVVFEKGCTEKLCEAVKTVAVEAAASRGSNASPTLSVVEQDTVRDLGLMAQNSVQVPTLSGVLGYISRKLSELFPSNVVCILGIGDENVLETATRVPVGANLLSAVENETLARFQAFSGQTPSRDFLRTQRDRANIDSEGPSAFARFISMPVMDDDDFAGLLTFADPQNATPFTRSEVAVIATASIQVAAVLSALKTVRRHASRDPLTGVLNRLGLKDELEHAWSMSRRYDIPLAIALADVDSFKAVNDSYGHSVGDKVACEFAELISNAARSSDIIARYGGDEFVVVLLEADERGARVFAERLVNATREHVFRSQDERLKITVSVGVSSAQSAIPATTVTDLLNRADRALYTAKREGKDRVCIWPDQTVVVERPAPVVDAVAAESQQPPKTADKIMVIDDEPTILGVVRRILENDGLQVETFKSADSAIQRLGNAGKEEFALIITDLQMPGKSGLQFLHEIRAISELTVKIVITGYATVESTVCSLREGVYDVIQKPFNVDDFTARVNKAIDYYRLRIENARYREHLQELVHERSAQLAESLEELRKSHEFTLDAMVAMLDAREYQTARHSLRVRELAVALGKRVGFDEKQMEALAKGALLHDIGKISVPDAILLKTGPLLPEEWEIMKRHPETGYRILSTGFHMKEVSELVRTHHEHYDGTGYPLGLKGKNIPIGARVFALVDAYEAMRSERVYRATMPVEEAIRQIKEGIGTQFDPDIAEVALKCQPEFEWILRAK